MLPFSVFQPAPPRRRRVREEAPAVSPPPPPPPPPVGQIHVVAVFPAPGEPTVATWVFDEDIDDPSSVPVGLVVNGNGVRYRSFENDRSGSDPSTLVTLPSILALRPEAPARR